MSDSKEKGVEHKVRFLDHIDKWSNCVINDLSNGRVSEIFQDCVCVNTHQETKSSNDKQADKLAKKIKNAIIDYTTVYVRGVLTECLEDNDFDQKFQILNDIGEKYKDQNKQAWRPPYEAVDHMRAVRVKTKQVQLSQLKLLINLKKQTIAGLKDKMSTSSLTLIKTNDIVNQIEEDFNNIRNKSTASIESKELIIDQLRTAMDNRIN